MIAFRTAAKIGLHGLVEAPWRMLATLALSACALGALGMSVSAAAFDVRSAKEQVLFEDGYVVQSMGAATEEDAEEAERAAGVSLARLSSTGGFRDFTLFLGAEPQGKLELSSCLTASPEWLMYADGEYLSAVGAEVIGRLPEREGEVALSLCLVNSFLEFGYYDNIASPTQFDEDHEMIRDESFLYEFDSAEALVAAGCRLTMTVGYEEPGSTLTIVGAVDEHCTHDHRAADFVQRAEPFDKVYLSREQFTSCAEVFSGGAWSYLLAPKGERAGDRGGLVAYVEEQEALSFSSTLLSSLEGYGTPGYRNSQFGKPAEENPTGIESPVYEEATGDYAISYRLEQAGYVCRAWIYDASGRLVREVVNHESLGTNGVIRWNGLSGDGSKARTGVYI